MPLNCIISLGVPTGAFRARAIVAADVDDDRVVELAHLFDGVDDAADFVVGISEVSGVDVNLTQEKFPLFFGGLIPVLQDIFGQGVSFASCGITPSFFWFSNICSRRAFQPLSNRCMSLIFLIHSGVAWCGACVPPGT